MDQFYQKEVGKVEVLYVPFQNLSSEDEEALCNLFQTKVGNAISVSVRKVEQMMLTNRAKFKLIIQDVK